MGRGAKKLDPDAKAFIEGKAASVRLKPPTKQALGYSPAQATASGAGTHGGSKKTKTRRARKAARRELRGGDWD